MDKSKFFHLSSFIKFLLGKMLFLLMYLKKQTLFCKDDIIINKALVLLMGPLHSRLVMDLIFDIVLVFTYKLYKHILQTNIG